MCKKVLMVCLGNICRSPAAEGYLHYLNRVQNLGLKIDSAGTAGYHEGEAPHKTMIKTAAKRGIDIGSQKSRPVKLDDFYSFDFILAMDRHNYDDLINRAPVDSRASIHLLLEFSGAIEFSVPDPYYGGVEGFEACLDIIERGVDAFVAYLKKEKLIKCV